MKLLLDQHYSPEIANQLQDVGHDVTAVTGDPNLEGMDDEPLLRVATEQGRALLTNNVSDFAPMAQHWAIGGEEHLGVIFTSDESLPRSRNTIGLYVERLRERLDQHPADDAFRGRVDWL